MQQRKEPEKEAPSSIENESIDYSSMDPEVLSLIAKKLLEDIFNSPTLEEKITAAFELIECGKVLEKNTQYKEQAYDSLIHAHYFLYKALPQEKDFLINAESDAEKAIELGSPEAHFMYVVILEDKTKLYPETQGENEDKKFKTLTHLVNFLHSDKNYNLDLYIDIKALLLAHLYYFLEKVKGTETEKKTLQVVDQIFQNTLEHSTFFDVTFFQNYAFILEKYGSVERQNFAKACHFVLFMRNEKSSLDYLYNYFKQDKTTIGISIFAQFEAVLEIQKSGLFDEKLIEAFLQIIRSLTRYYNKKATEDSLIANIMKLSVVDLLVVQPGNESHYDYSVMEKGEKILLSIRHPLARNRVNGLLRMINARKLNLVELLVTQPDNKSNYDYSLLEKGEKILLAIHHQLDQQAKNRVKALFEMIDDRKKEKDRLNNESKKEKTNKNKKRRARKKNAAEALTRTLKGEVERESSLSSEKEGQIKKSPDSDVSIQKEVQPEANAKKHKKVPGIDLIKLLEQKIKMSESKPTLVQDANPTLNPKMDDKSKSNVLKQESDETREKGKEKEKETSINVPVATIQVDESIKALFNQLPPGSLLVGRYVQEKILFDTGSSEYPFVSSQKIEFVVPMPHGNLEDFLPEGNFEKTDIDPKFITYEDKNRNIKIQFSSYLNDSLLRDARKRNLTIKAFYADQDGNVFDPTGRSFKDLKDRNPHTIVTQPLDLASFAWNPGAILDLIAFYMKNFNQVYPLSALLNQYKYLDKKYNRITDAELYGKLDEFFVNGHALASFDTLRSFKLIPYLFPGMDKREKSVEWLKKRLAEIDEDKISNSSLIKAHVYMYLLATRCLSDNLSPKEINIDLVKNLMDEFRFPKDLQDLILTYQSPNFKSAVEFMQKSLRFYKAENQYLALKQDFSPSSPKSEPTDKFSSKIKPIPGYIKKDTEEPTTFQPAASPIPIQQENSQELSYRTRDDSHLQPAFTGYANHQFCDDFYAQTNTFVPYYHYPVFIGPEEMHNFYQAQTLPSTKSRQYAPSKYRGRLFDTTDNANALPQDESNPEEKGVGHSKHQ